MVVGALAPFLLLLEGGVVLSGWGEIRAVLLFGPVFGGSMAYYLHRTRHVEQRHGRFAAVVLSSGLAGAATAAVAHELGYLASTWWIAAGFVLGALLAVWLEISN